jgi:hypothetical protein
MARNSRYLFLTVLEAKTLKSRSQPGRLPVRALEKSLFLALGGL